MKHNLILKAMAVAALMLCQVTTVNAQSVLEKATFEAPKKIVRPTGNWVNLRTSPSTRAAKVKDDWGGNAGVSKHQVFDIISENNGWYQIAKGQWISKTVCKPAKCGPITDKMMNRFFGWSEGYDSYAEWTISPVGKQGFYLYFTQSDGLPMLRLGKKVGNVLVFKYTIVLQNIYISEDSKDAKKFELQQATYDGDERFTLTVGSNFVRPMKQTEKQEAVLHPPVPRKD